MNFSSEQNRNTIAHSTAGWKSKPKVEDGWSQESDWSSAQIDIINGANAWQDGEEKPDKAGSNKTISSGVSAGKVANSVGSWKFILESEDETSCNTEWWSEKEKSVSVAIVRDDVPPGNNFIESIKEDSEEAEDNDLESANSSGDSHVSDKHGKGANKSISHTILSVVWTAESPVVGCELNQIVRSTAQTVSVIVVSQSDSNPEASDDEVILDSEYNNQEWEEGGWVCGAGDVGVNEGKAWVK